MYKRILRILLKSYTKIKWDDGIAKVIFDDEFEDITEEIVKLFDIPNVSCCYPHLDKAIKDLEHKVNKEGFEDSRDLNSAYQVLLSIKATKKYFISNCS